MNQASTDYLLQSIPTGSNRASSMAGSGDRATGFVDHLSHASTSVFDALRPSARVESSAESRNSDRDKFAPADDDSNREPGADIVGSEVPPGTNPNEASDADDECARNCESTNAANRADNEHSTIDEDDNDAAADAAQVAASGTASQSAHTEADANGLPSSDEASTTRNVGDDIADHEVDSANVFDPRVPQTVIGQSASDADVKLPATGNPSTVTAATLAEDETTEQETQQPATALKDKVGREGNQIDTAKESLVRKRESDGDQRPAPDQAALASDAAANTLERALSTNSRNASSETAVTNTAKSSERDSRRGAKPAARSTDVHTDRELPASNVDGKSAVVSPTNVATTAGNFAAVNEKVSPPTKQATTKYDAPIGPLTGAMRAATQLARGGRSSDTGETPQVDPTRFVGRVAKAFHTALDRGGTLQLRLSPPELGALKLQLTVKDGILTAALETDNADARRILLDHLPALRERLAEQNIRVERFDVDVQQDQNRGHANPRGTNQHAHQHSSERSDPRRSATTEARTDDAPLPESPPAVSRMVNSQINLVV
jgi:flagellar hook-length control protein FliK